MSSYLCFQHFRSLPRLDKFVSGIPNAITKAITDRRECCGGRGPAFYQYRKNRSSAGMSFGSDCARDARELKTDAREEAMSNSKDAVRKILDTVKADKRTSLTAPEGKLVCDAYGIPVPKEGVAKSAA